MYLAQQLANKGPVNVSILVLSFSKSGVITLAQFLWRLKHLWGCVGKSRSLEFKKSRFSFSSKSWLNY